MIENALMDLDSALIRKWWDRYLDKIDDSLLDGYEHEFITKMRKHTAERLELARFTGKPWNPTRKQYNMVKMISEGF